MTTMNIAVLGAGLSGLAAANRLVSAGHTVTVYEARERVGGRVWSETIRALGSDHVIERGAEFVLGGYTSLTRYCMDFGLSLVDTGMSYYIRTPADRPNVSVDDMATLGGQAAAVAAAEGGGHEPLSVADVLDSIGVSGDTREALEARIEMSTAVRVDQVTAEGTLDAVASFKPGPSWRIAGGNQRLPLEMAAALGDRVRLGTPVETVLQTQHGVLVTAAGQTETYDFAIVALPFAILSDPFAIGLDLPEWKTKAMKHVVQGNAAKLHLALTEVPETSAVMSVRDRFWTWTANGENGKVAPVLNCFGGEIGHLLRLGIGDDGRLWEQRVRDLRNDLPFADASAIVTAWPLDPLSGGSYTAHAPGFSADDAHALAAPFGRLHFAGEYIDTDFTGLMEGALRSGERAAEAIVESLRIAA